MIINTVLNTNPKLSSTLATMKKINCIAVKTSTGNIMITSLLNSVSGVTTGITHYLRRAETEFIQASKTKNSCNPMKNTIISSARYKLTEVFIKTIVSPEECRTCRHMKVVLILREGMFTELCDHHSLRLQYIWRYRQNFSNSKAVEC